MSGARRLQQYYPHALGHFLGIDVHDTPSLSSETPLAPGMALARRKCRGRYLTPA